MAIRDIVYLGDPVLREETAPVPTSEIDDDLRALVQDMFETMYHAEGVGLAAPQIGLSKRVFVVDTRDEKDPAGGKYAVINPRIVVASDEMEKEVEGCLSIPGVEEMVERPWSVVLEGLDPDGNELRIEADGLLARALQHELDHLDGVLFLDRVSALKRRMLVKKWKKLQAEAVG